MSQKPRHPEKVNKPINPIKKKPEWIRSKIVDSKIFFQTKTRDKARGKLPPLGKWRAGDPSSRQENRGRVHT